MRKIELGYLKIDETGRRYISEVLDSGRLSAGKFIASFEKKFARQHSCQFGIMCNSGTSALQVALAALKEQRCYSDGDEVLVPSVTFVATSNIVLQNRMVPVFVDVDPQTYNINPDEIPKRISDKTRAVIPVHLFGLPCEMDPIADISKKERLGVIEDSCETMFVRYKGRHVGSFGDLACFSTYVAHLLVTGVGGLILTCDEELAILCRSYINHGRDAIYLNIDDDDLAIGTDRFFEIINKRFSFVRMGYSYRVTEIEGALGLAALEEQASMLEKRHNNALYLMSGLKDLESYLQLPSWPPYSEHAFMLFPLVVRPPVEREGLLFFLEQRGIETRTLMPLLSQPFYRKLFGDLEKDYPVASVLNRRGFYIGCHQGLTQDDLDYVLEQFHEFFRQI